MQEEGERRGRRSQPTFSAMHEHFQSVLDVIEFIFTDAYIYKNHRFKALVEANPKGFVPIREIIKEPILISYLRGREEKEQQILMQIETQTKSNSKKLCCKNLQIKRIEPFVDRIKTGEVKLIYIEKFEKMESHEEILNFLQRYFPVYQMYACKGEEWALVYTEKWRELHKRDSQIFIDFPNIVLHETEEAEAIYEQVMRFLVENQAFRIYSNKEFFKYLPSLEYESRMNRECIEMEMMEDMQAMKGMNYELMSRKGRAQRNREKKEKVINLDNSVLSQL